MRLLDLLTEVKQEIKMYTNNDIKGLIDQIINYWMHESSISFTSQIYTSTFNTTEYQALERELNDAKIYIIKRNVNGIRTRVLVTNREEDLQPKEETCKKENQFRASGITIGRAHDTIERALHTLETQIVNHPRAMQEEAPEMAVPQDMAHGGIAVETAARPSRRYEAAIAGAAEALGNATPFGGFEWNF